MKRDDLLTWFDEIGRRDVGDLFADQGFGPAAIRWMADASSAIAAVLPVGHPILAQWRVPPSEIPSVNPFGELNAVWHTARGLFASVHAQVREGRLESLVDIVRAETEDDLLDQAATLLDAGYLPSATVLAGGALEAHLRRLCDKHSLTVSTPPSIDNYNQAIARARKTGNVIYEKADGSLVTGRGQMRNEAAHQPGTFQRTQGEVDDMISWIRGFITRVR